MKNTYMEIDFVLRCYGICSVGGFWPSNLNPGGQTPHPWLRERTPNITVRRSSAGCEGYHSPSLGEAGKRPGQERKKRFNIQYSKSNTQQMSHGAAIQRFKLFVIYDSSLGNFTATVNKK
jgi:hypothetical protein